MTEICFAASDYAALTAHLLPCVVEKCAIAYASPVVREDGRMRLLVREIEWPSEADYSSQREMDVELTPSAVARVSKRAKRLGLSLAFVHCHPGLEPPVFSPVDDAGEGPLAAFLARRIPDQQHVAIVVSAGGARARVLGTKEPVRVISLGERRDIIYQHDAQRHPDQTAFDRQIRAFGRAGQRLLSTLQVAIVGLGGTGSIIAEQLAHLGVRHFTLIDPDVIEITNLNRVVGACADSLQRPKVDVAAEHIHRISPHARIKAIQGNIVYAKHARPLQEADVIFGCTDSHGSRAVLQQVAYQYLIPCIDMGSIIPTKNGKVDGIFGRVQLLSPGQACFTCSGLLDYAEVRRDMADETERELDPYLQGAREPAPAVISLNGTVSSMAVTMFLAFTTGIPSRGRYLIYNAVGPSLRSVRSAPNPDCFICSRAGVFAHGNGRALMARLD